MDYLNHAITSYYALLQAGGIDYFKTFIIYFILFFIIFLILYILLKK